MERIHENIFLVRGLLSKDECLEFINKSENIGYEEALFNQSRVENLRNNDRVIVDDVDIADFLWKRVRDDLDRTFRSRVVVGVNERLRYYRYDPGQKFDWHLDGYYERHNGERSQLTFMIYLNDDFEGGETKFLPDYSRELEIEPETGSALLFEHAISHTGAEVRRGRKYVLRSDIMYSRPLGGGYLGGGY